MGKICCRGVFSITTDPGDSGTRQRSPTAPCSSPQRHAFPHGDYVYLLLELAGYRGNRVLQAASLWGRGTSYL